MGLFSTVLHIYRKNQQEIVNALLNELKQGYGFSSFLRLNINDFNYKEVFESNVYTKQGIFYLVTQTHGNWVTVIELNVSIDNPLYLSSLTDSLSKRLDTYVLLFHLYDGDVLFYNLSEKGIALDGYSSNYQYFLEAAADRSEVLPQRHTPEYFETILPETKSIKQLNSIINEGYWEAFDNNELDSNGVPSDDKYFIDEENRFITIGKYLEIYSTDAYPFADWLSNLTKLNLSACYLLKAER